MRRPLWLRLESASGKTRSYEQDTRPYVATRKTGVEPSATDKHQNWDSAFISDWPTFRVRVGGWKGSPKTCRWRYCAIVAGEKVSAEPSVFRSGGSTQQHYRVQVELNTGHLKVLCWSDYLRPGSQTNEVMGVDNTERNFNVGHKGLSANLRWWL